MTTSDEFSAEVPALLMRHFEHLRSTSGLSVDVINERRCRSVLNRKELKTLGFGRSQQRAPGLLLPVWSYETWSATVGSLIRHRNVTSKETQLWSPANYPGGAS